MIARVVNISFASTYTNLPLLYRRVFGASLKSISHLTCRNVPKLLKILTWMSSNERHVVIRGAILGLLFNPSVLWLYECV